MFSIKNLISTLKGANVGQPAEPEYYLAVCCIVKNENDYLREWLEYHRKIGVEHFFIYDNGSEIPVEETVNTLGFNSFATVIEMPGKRKQVKAYQHCIDRFGKRARWIAFIDMDEFIVPKTDDVHLPKLLEKYENYGGLGVSWLIFGSNNHQRKPAGSQLENFTKRAEVDFLPNRHIKSIVQPQHVRAADMAHCFYYKQGFFCVNEHFMPIPHATADPSVDFIQLNHYYCRSFQEYHQKVARGNADTKRKRKLEEFHNHDRDANAVVDTTILDILKRLENSQPRGVAK
ncbi:glycosyltransferase family 2 protein [Dyadobacter beijingensis]|nr:glycosyltransferase family 2 protein [Dyadobacter beijingensis]